MPLKKKNLSGVGSSTEMRTQYLPASLATAPSGPVIRRYWRFESISKSFAFSQYALQMRLMAMANAIKCPVMFLVKSKISSGLFCGRWVLLGFQIYIKTSFRRRAGPGGGTVLCTVQHRKERKELFLII